MEYIILDDLFGIKLWNENIFRRVYHHLSNNNYNPRKIPLLHEVREGLMDEEVAYLQGLTFKKDNGLNTSKLSLLVGGQYSPRDSLYFNNMDKEMQDKLEEMGNRLIPSFEMLIGTKLRLGDSNFRACIIRYEGANAQFGFHYDTEHPDCFRALFLYDREGIIPPFCYVDGTMRQIHFQIKDGILFRGTTTHHGVEPSNDPNTKRYLVGFQYIKADSDQIEKPNLTNQLRGTSILTILQLFLPYSVYYQIPTYLPTYFPIEVALFGMMGILSPTNTIQSVGLFYFFCCLMTFNAGLALQITAYILLTELWN